MNESPEDLAAVEQLLAESDALRGWLARLDLAAGDVPSAVRNRVRADYQGRLDQLTLGLRAHGDVIAARLSDDRAEHDGLQERAGASREALAEAELRHAVGEYDGNRFEEERSRHSGDLETFDLAIAAVAERIDRLAQVQSLVASGGRTPVAEPAAPPAPAPPIPPAPVIEPPVAAAPAPVDEEPVAIAALAPDDDGRDDLSIFEEQVLSVEVDDTPSASTPASAPAEVGPLSFRPTGTAAAAAAPPARPRPFDSAPPLGMPQSDPPRFVRPGERMSPPTGAPPAAAAEAPTPRPPRATSSDSAMPTATEVHEAAAAMQVGRTLRCGECGAMNRPLEWYCEKCGAELMAM